MHKNNATPEILLLFYHVADHFKISEKPYRSLCILPEIRDVLNSAGLVKDVDRQYHPDEAVNVQDRTCIQRRNQRLINQ